MIKNRVKKSPSFVSYKMFKEDMDEQEDEHFKLPNSLFSSYSTAFSKMKQPSYLKLNTIS